MTTMEGDLRDNNRYRPEWPRSPVEFRRYASAAGLLESRSERMHGGGDTSNPWQKEVLGIRIVKEMFA